MRLACEEFWNDLKRGHLIDERTRIFTITMAIRSNHLGVRSRTTLMLEFTSTGAVLPSYDMETRVESKFKRERSVNESRGRDLSVNRRALGPVA